MQNHKPNKLRAPLIAICLLAVLGGGIGIGLRLSKNQIPKTQSLSAEEIALIKSIPKPSAEAQSLSLTVDSDPDAPRLINALLGLNNPEQAAQTDILILDHLFEEVNTLFHDMPTGTHDEIVTFLLGDNPRSFAYFQPNNPALDKDKKIIDRWGTPYFFHVQGRQDMEVRSAGPDKIHWSEDDIVTENSETAHIAKM